MHVEIKKIKKLKNTLQKFEYVYENNTFFKYIFEQEYQKNKQLKVFT